MFPALVLSLVSIAFAAAPPAARPTSTAVAPAPQTAPIVRPAVAATIATLRKNAQLDACYDDLRIAFTDAYIAAIATFPDTASPGSVAVDTATATNPHLRPQEKLTLAAFMVADTMLADAGIAPTDSPWNGVARDRLRTSANAIVSLDAATVQRIATRTTTLPCHQRTFVPAKH
jgi:hypothetical protein